MSAVRCLPEYNLQIKNLTDKVIFLEICLRPSEMAYQAE